MSDPNDISWVEHHMHPRDKVTIIERFVPADDGEYAPFMFRPAGQTEWVAMKLESRRIVPTDSRRRIGG